MKKRNFARAVPSMALFAAFALWTAAVCRVDVRAIGPGGSSVGFAAMNGWVHGLTGVHMALYTLMDWLGLVPLCFVLCFALTGLVQLLRRKSFSAVDRGLLALGVCYALTAAAYLLFEICVVNYRPVLIDGRLEASYPSSTMLLAVCVLPTAAMELRARLAEAAVRRLIPAGLIALTVFMVTARLVSGVHWASDIIGGVLFGAGVVRLYRALAAAPEKE